VSRVEADADPARLEQHVAHSPDPSRT
jgi:hypothetical protein